MRSPALTLAGNLRWTRSGTVWADWQLSALPYGFRPGKDKHVVRGLHQALFRALPGESLLQGVCSRLDAGTVVQRMIDGVDLAACPDWAAECEATLDTLDEISPGQRTYWLSVPLGATTNWDRLREPWRSASGRLRDSLALPRAGIPAGDLQRRFEQARRVAAALPHLFRPRPATPAQMLWLHLHAQQRGAQVDLDVPGNAGSDLAGQLGTVRAGMMLPEPVLDEGGQSDVNRRDRRAWNPLDRRYVKVSQPDRPEVASYQSLLVLTDVPAEGMHFPGSEFLGRIDESGLEVDWAIRLQVLGSHDAAAKNRRALVHLNEQYGQRDGEQSHGLKTLDRAAGELAEYAAVLDADTFEVEVQPTTIFTVAGPDPISATDQARALTGYFADAGYKLSQPLGYQEEFWWATHCGVPTTRGVREFAQITTSKALASAVPLASTDLGDDRGSLLGLNISSGRPGVALHDMEGAAVRDVSGSVAIVGELGAGKALAIDVPIPTPTGWSRMGDLTVGDEVFDEQGQPTGVLGTSPVMTSRPCYEVIFSDGSSITADAEHLWSVWPELARSKRNRSRDTASTAVLRTTKQLADTQPAVNPRPRFGVQVCKPVLFAGSEGLVVPPYTLGLWLSDGHTAGGRITTTDPDVLELIRKDGFDVTAESSPFRYGVRGLRVLLRRAGVLGNKHVPEAYQFARIEDRRALLAGLLDGDGSCTPAGTVRFRNTNPRLIEAVRLLAVGLGYVPYVRWEQPTGSGFGGKRRQLSALVTFTPGEGETVFGGGIKSLRQCSHRTSSRTAYRYVVDVREVPSVPVRCIRVASASRLFLAGRSMIPTHNSLTLKSLAGDVVDRGGRVVAVDRTQMGEYARWASSVTRATVVDAADPAWSLDPLRLFGLTVGSRVTQTFLTPLLNIAPTSERGVLLSDALDPAYLVRHAVSSLGGLLAHLADRSPAGCQLAGADQLARVMNVFARRDFGRVVFDASLPVLQPDAPAVVIRTHTLELPSREELAHEHLFSQLGLEKLFGRALYALVAALARQICFADPGRLGVFLVDEAHHVTASPEGERELAVFSRDGRKHKAALLLGTHDPEEDLGTATLRGLIPTRILMRHRDKTLARRGLAYLGLDPDDDELLQMLTEDTSPVTARGVEEHRRGEAFLRDSSGNIGRIKVLPPALPDRNAAVRTSPPDARAVVDPAQP